jgi:hypothetical protein
VDGRLGAGREREAGPVHADPQSTVATELDTEAGGTLGIPQAESPRAAAARHMTVEVLGTLIVDRAADGHAVRGGVAAFPGVAIHIGAARGNTAARRLAEAVGAEHVTEIADHVIAASGTVTVTRAPMSSTGTAQPAKPPGSRRRISRCASPATPHREVQGWRILRSGGVKAIGRLLSHR